MARLTLILGVLATVVYLLDGFRFMLNEWRNWRHRRRRVAKLIMCALVVSSFATPALAQTATTVGALTTSVTFDTIWVKATYSDDSNDNNSMALQYKLASSSTWLDAYSPAPDRRSTVSGGNSNAANQYQFRSGVFGLTTGQTYDVRVTYIDGDGVTGGPTLSATVTLLSDATVVRSGSTYYLDDVGSNGDGSSGSPFNTFANALTGSACGDKLIVRPGSYANFTFSKVCTDTTWYVIEGENRDTVLITDGTTAQSTQVVVDGNFFQLKNIRSTSTYCRFLSVLTDRHDVWFENIRLDDINTSVATFGDPATYNCNGVTFSRGTYHGYVLNSLITSPALHTNGDHSFESPSAGIIITGSGGFGANAIGGFVFKGNTIGTSGNGGFRDCISNDGPEGINGGANYSDVLNNTLIGCYDDSIQLEGDNIDLLIAGNIVDGSYGNSCFANEAPGYGPVFYLRNTCRLYSLTSGGTVWKWGGAQFMFVFHTSVEVANSSFAGMSGTSDTKYITAYNNIFSSNENPLYRIYDTGTFFDYNRYWKPSGNANVTSEWNGTGTWTLAAFQSNTINEDHGSFGNPSYSDTALHLQSNSPAIDAGVSLANINTADSAWPSNGLAPDMGAYEYVDTVSTQVVIGRVIRWMELLLPVAGLGWHCRRAFAMGAATIGRYSLVLSRVVAAISYQSCLFTLQIATTAMKGRNNG